MKHLSGIKVDLNAADIFTMMNEHAYAAFMGVLSNIYMKAHATAPFRTNKYQAAILINDEMTKSYKGQPDTTLYRLNKIINRMKEPRGGIDIGIYLVPNKMFSPKAKIGLKHTVSQCWPLLNEGKKKHVTANLPPQQLNVGDNKVRYFTRQDLNKQLNTSVLCMNYNYSIDYVFESLEESKMHICYQGGTAWLSIAMNIPTIIVHPTKISSDHHLKYKIYGQDLGNINILDEHDKIMHVRQHPYEFHTSIKNLAQYLKEFK